MFFQSDRFVPIAPVDVRLHPEGISVILDCLSGEEISKSYSLLKPLGKYILYGMSNLVTGDRKNLLSLAKHVSK
ncbi:putative vesicle amine transport protein [Fasciola gigantica]|uniref:Putative vesicle amine transport protein n=1 Tax=Fasciola gigantica TaxID=46835 RepID=A0A504YMW1_FASGI|nr:putative vesicle amine transport protein [Fasciola gigantica]